MGRGGGCAEGEERVVRDFHFTLESGVSCGSNGNRVWSSCIKTFMQPLEWISGL